MKARELMLEDWVLYGKRYAIVKRIEYSRCDILVNINPRHDDIVVETYDNIDAIPLTREILDKNFKGYGGSLTTNKNHKYYDIDLDYVIISYPSGGVTFCYNYEDSEIAAHDKIGLVELKDVHTLQHTLRLFGIDKEIVL